MYFKELNIFLIKKIKKLVNYYDDLVINNNDNKLEIIIKDLLNLCKKLLINNIDSLDFFKDWFFYWYIISLIMYYYYFPEPPCKRQFIRVYGGWQSFLEAAYMWNRPVFLIYERVEHYFYVEDDLEEYEEIFFLYDLVLECKLVSDLTLNALTVSRNFNKLFYQGLIKRFDIFSKNNKYKFILFSDFYLLRFEWLHFSYEENIWLTLDSFDKKYYPRNKKQVWGDYPSKAYFFSEFFRYEFIISLVIYSRFILSFEQLKINDYILGDWLPESPSIFFKFPIIYEGVPNYGYIFPETISPIKLMEDYSKRSLLFRKRPYFFKYSNTHKNKKIKELTLRRDLLLSWSHTFYFKNLNIKYLNSNWHYYCVWVPDWLSHNLLNKGVFVNTFFSSDINLFTNTRKICVFKKKKKTRRDKKRTKALKIRHYGQTMPEAIAIWEDAELNQLAIDWFPFKSEYIKFREEV